MEALYLVILGLCSYLFGNVNFAKLISRCKKDDITKHGSGNPGTLNMLRTFGFKWAIFNMLLEIAKGAIPTLIGKLWLGQIGMYVAGVCVILGHIFPVIFKFKGGKGVAAFAGFSLFALPWWVFLIVFAVCFGIAKTLVSGTVPISVEVLTYISSPLGECTFTLSIFAVILMLALSPQI